MAQHDYVIANGTGAAVRSDLNNALAAIVSQNSGATEPATMYAYQWWADTSTGLLKLRNGANNAWITLRELDGTLTIEAGTVSAPGLAFASDLNTGVWSPGADQFAIATNGVERVEWGTSEVVFNDGGANYDFRIEGDTNSSLFFVDASAEAVGIGTTAPYSILNVYGSDGLTLSMTESGWQTAALKPINEGGGYQGALAFFTHPNAGTKGSATEKARLTSDGKLLVGTSSASGFQTGTRHIFMDGAGTSYSSVSIGNPGGAANNTDLNITAWSGGGSNYYTSKIRQIGDGSLTFHTQASASSDGAGSATERLRITSTGQVRLAGAGITFNGDTATANELDDYEEGTWTPTVTAGSGSFTTVSTSGRYVKIGKTVLIAGQVNITNAGTAAGAINITNPPFNAAANDTFCGSAARRDTTLAPGGFVKFQNNTSFNIVEYDGTTLIATGNQIIFSIFYEVS